ncbi:modification methylase [Aphanothece hegewaldii CCALA 016]|uniref:site-specific DNA-methyltransferase (adenine-specific) n=1 Tax=Aphanothece hegewaldii CCALA 016 TaxID=2107694 RepID=A0A2T1LY07_9CHRO|nr:modification methylase [Aphanothece hegewaldii CCALA 016]
MIKSPLRYPGGKSRAIKTIIPYLPPNFSEYREPFVGGGSLFIYLKQKYPNFKIWINDLNPELFLFWKIAQSHLTELVNEIKKIKATCTGGKTLFNELTTINIYQLSDLKRAVRFFILNRITFSGTIESGGYSEEAFQKRFTDSSISRLSKMDELLKNVKITNLDYSELLIASEKEIFIYLDPPYLSVTQSRLYGKKGNLHLAFDHTLFAERLEKCHHNWLITYDDCQLVRDKFNKFHIFEWELQYGMNNYKQKTAAIGKELMITNYSLTNLYSQLITSSYE